MADDFLSAGKLELPGSMIGAVRDRAIDSGVLAKLSPEQPTIFGPVQGAVFSGVPRAK
ncbi:major capsid protein, partial [Enterococcus faecalis]